MGRLRRWMVLLVMVVGLLPAVSGIALGDRSSRAKSDASLLEGRLYQLDSAHSSIEWIFTPRRPQDPAADSLFARIADRGIGIVAREYRRARAADSLVVQESALNTLGHFLIQKGRLREAMEVFGLETESFPRHAFGYVGLGHAAAMAGDRERAAASCRKALALNPDATRAIEVLRSLDPPRN